MSDESSKNNPKVKLLIPIYEWSVKCFQEETARTNSLIEQSSSLIVTQSILIAFTGILLSFSDKVDVDFKVILYFSLGPLCTLFASMFFALLMQKREIYNKRKSPLEYYDMVRDKQKLYFDESKFLEDEIGVCDRIVSSIASINDKRVKKSEYSSFLLYTSIVLLLIMLFSILSFS